MSSRGVRAEVVITDPSACRVVGASQGSGQIQRVTRSSVPNDGRTAVEFTATDDHGAEGVEEVFCHGDETVYRFARDASETPACACEHVETHGPPVRHLRATDGALVLSFLAGDVATVRSVVVDLREEFSGVSLRRLTRSAGPDDEEELVVVDRATLTDRQREVLETAHEMGYFEHPRSANATDVSEALDINRSTFAEHLASAQSKLLNAILDD
ncbi:helix-turn-helix domain-containing protein [Salinirubrum litoreum]|uniref:Helix-turn-helix domain-containing protein n=1 Tax=Salinirubrum litoreum TaxID=1126234 RepID=A0ABD5RBV2_9EURY|nr:helix-turn-helix domain-containing protein [Salinirubrum litoreum]